MPQRTPWIDSVRGVAICLVVIGHVTSNTIMHNTIYLFHMPLFFFLSGMLFTLAPPRMLLIRKLAAFAPPYLAYLISFGPIFQIHHVAKNNRLPYSSTDVIQTAFIDLLHGGTRLKAALGVFWFVPCLFFVIIIYGLSTWYMRNRHPVLLILWIAMLYTIGTIINPLEHFNPLNASVSLIAILYLAAGHLLAPYLTSEDRRPLVFLALAAVLATLATVTLNPSYGWHIDLKNAVSGPFLFGPVLSVALCILFIETVRLISRYQPVGDTLGYLGQAALPIMFVHMPVLVVLRMLEKGAALKNPEWLSICLAIAISLLAYEVSRRLNPPISYFSGVSSYRGH